MMRILYITPFFQHPLVHGPTRHYHFIRELSQRHTITLLTPIKSPIPPEAMQEMSLYTDRILTFDTRKDTGNFSKNGIGALSAINKRFGQIRRSRRAVQEMKTTFRQLAHQDSFDVILFHGKSVFTIIEDWNGLPIVADFCDATSLRIVGMMPYVNFAKKPVLMLKYYRIRQLEQKMVRKTPYLAFISARDKEAILGINSKARIVPNFVDIQYWSRKASQPETNCIMFSGAMDYRPNVDGALHLIKRILPFVRQRVPTLNVLIVGRDPHPELLEAATPYTDVTITGSVEDMRPYFERASVFAAPLRFASGQQNKLLESMAMEVPVVTTPISAAGVRMDGVEAPVKVAEGDMEFAEEIINLLQSEAERNRLAGAGRRFIEDHFGWSRSAEILEEMCKQAVEQFKLPREQLIKVNL